MGGFKKVILDTSKFYSVVGLVVWFCFVFALFVFGLL